MKLASLFAGSVAMLSLTALAGVAAAAPPGRVSARSESAIRHLEAGQPPVIIHLTVAQAQSLARARHGRPGHHGKPHHKQKTNNLIYGGGTAGIGVETAPKIYLVFWGSQWKKNDPSHEASRLESFLDSIGGSTWQNTVTQYCEYVLSGTIFCKGAGTAAGNLDSELVGTWYDSGKAAPSKPRQSQFATEALLAAQHFGNTAAGSNDNTQYVIATAYGYNSSGFGRQYCAYHSYATSTNGDVAYTNLPYITEAGANCGANFNGLGTKAGITIVEGHEAAETMTDPYPSSGWLDSSGEEIGDKCAWITSGQGKAAKVTFPDGDTFAVQSLWSNVFNSDAGGCVMSYY